MTHAIEAADVAAFFAPAEKDKAKRVAGVPVEKELFEQRHEKDNLRWAGKLLAQIEDHAASALFKEYQYRLNKNQTLSANIWLRKSVEQIREHAARFPLPLRMVASELGRANIAREWSNACAAIVQEKTANFTTPVNAEQLLDAAMEPARKWGISPLLPSFSKACPHAEISDQHIDMAVSAVARLQDAEWWERQITRAWRRYAEHVAILIGKVRKGVSAYVSQRSLQDYRARKQAGAAWLKTMYAINPELELEVPLADAVKASVANPEIRRMELMVRMRGFEEVAEEQDLVGEFYTWTAPSRFHAWTIIKDKDKDKGKDKGKDKTKPKKTVRNTRYDGSTPRHTQRYLCGQWAKARAKLARLGVRFFGFRVVEPHHDGTPHWHMLFFVHPSQRLLLRWVLRKYACEHDKKELAKSYKPRFDWSAIDPAKGTATGYIAKYIAKNIDGFNMDWDEESEEAISTAVPAVAAWSSLWGIRQFQQVGGPSVTVWRELRRLREATQNPILEPARKAADAGKWAAYVDAMGGIDAARKDHPIQLAHLVKPAASKYGEDVAKLTGLRTANIFTSVNGTATGIMVGMSEAQTRHQGWELSRTGLGERSELPSGKRSELPLSGDSRAPWSSDNNCTRGSVLAEKDPLDREMAMLGLDARDKKLLLNGAVIEIDGLFVSIRNGCLNTCRQRPNVRPEYDKLDHDLEPLKSGKAYWKRRIQGELFTGNTPVNEWLKTVPEHDLGDVIMQIDDMLLKERQLNPLTYKEDMLLVQLQQLIEETIADSEFWRLYLE
ncbi:replication endonuclease [Oceanisphaera psychrotolerans]|uniref:Replication protein n=1 Tax=Oceanisphaera psychrotolerans TaxID=1414654 RepID=A0A1J4QEX6_9GAMM|nr:replication endonuclease [Oceanisphaera psychrotolerans]OIN09096.1 replication protein [Oceanisphaera psychrotolerans]